MTNQYMNNLYRDLLSNSPQTITIDIPADMWEPVRFRRSSRNREQLFQTGE